MSDTGRSIEIEIEVPGTPEQVWEAIATGPGITSWYVPHEVEERTGGSMSASFGPGMDVTGRVADWSPPRRLVLDSEEVGMGLAFEWTIEARDGGTCVVRLVNSGFGEGADWDAQYDGMTEGWRLFFNNLHAHLTYFAGRRATASLPMAQWSGPADEAWNRAIGELGVDAATTSGDVVSLDGGDGLRLDGRVLEVGDHELLMLVDEPAPGTAFLAVEGSGDAVSVSIWSYLYDEDGARIAARDAPRWAEWLGERAPATSDG